MEKQAGFIHNLLRCIPRKEKVTIVAMAPLQEISTSPVLRAPHFFSTTKCASLYRICFPQTSALTTESDCDDMNMSSDSCLQRKDSGCDCQDSQSSDVSASYVQYKEIANGQPQSGENCSFSDATLSPEPSFKENDQLPAVTSKTQFAYQRSKNLPFVVTLKQHQNGIGLILGKSSASGLVCITDILSTGSAAQDGTLK